jgi:hypothetical protein
MYITHLILSQDEEEMAAASLQLDGMAAPAQVLRHYAPHEAGFLSAVDELPPDCLHLLNTECDAAGQLLAARAADAGAQPVL